ncbi:MAG: monofunctional biosynthetic peptidoglycan transglycosylase [Balneolaceae bacterium]|nr:monofunctional biosynthetic peptidoglycan transglycosylase [Balneolaceae bacterium]MDR9407293.1 monofunctional biosynthetic peptidoglycan transglycosylase [Balneolaceae bacterium]
MLYDLIKNILIAVLVMVFMVILTILALRWVNPPFTAFTLQADWQQLDRERYDLRISWVPYDEIPEHMIWSVVASEDQLFFQHHGFDLESIQEAWEEHREGERTRGASTITQQVAKNLFLSPVQSFIRKGVEAALTLCIELLWPKDRIIEVYLNIAEFGPGVFGIGEASSAYFNRPASQITPEMAARLAAVLPSPNRMRVNPPSPYTQERSLWILRQMNQLTGKTFHRFEDSITDNATENLPDTIGYATEPDTLFQSLPDTMNSVIDSTGIFELK